jgi:DNA helicase-2/ATP-dependent DNA helicase PcrA
VVSSPIERALVQDPEHERLLRLPLQQPALLCGPAGTGKSTLALRRLCAHARVAGRDLHALVVVPVEGLVRHLERLCARLGVRAEVVTFDDWVFRQGRRTFAEISARRSQDTPVAALAFKRHPAVREVLPELVPRRGPVSREQLLELWGDPRLLADIVQAAGGELTEDMARRVHQHALIQHSELDRDGDGRVIRGLGTPLAGGRALADGTPMQDAESLGPEDLAVLFELSREAGQGRRGTVEHLVVDEAQELAPLELCLLGRALRPGGTLTAVGDAAQQVDPTAWFRGWTAALAELGAPGAERFELERAFRSHPEIARFVRALSAGEPLPAPSEQVVWGLHPSEAERDRVLRDTLAAIPRELDCALVTSTAGQAQALRARLKVARPFVCTPVSEVRGQEFDVVLLPDAGPSAFPEQARAALYVAASRARLRLELHAVERFSALLA